MHTPSSARLTLILTAAAIAVISTQLTTRFGRPDNGLVIFKAKLVRYLREVTGQRFMFVRVMLGRFVC